MGLTFISKVPAVGVAQIVKFVLCTGDYHVVCDSFITWHEVLNIFDMHGLAAR